MRVIKTAIAVALIGGASPGIRATDVVGGVRHHGCKLRLVRGAVRPTRRHKQ